MASRANSTNGLRSPLFDATAHPCPGRGLLLAVEVFAVQSKAGKLMGDHDACTDGCCHVTCYAHHRWFDTVSQKTLIYARQLHVGYQRIRTGACMLHAVACLLRADNDCFRINTLLGNCYGRSRSLGRFPTLQPTTTLSVAKRCCNNVD